MKVLLVYPRYPVTYMGFQYSVPLAGAKASLPPLGLLTVAAMLPRAWQRRLVDLNVTTLEDEHRPAGLGQVCGSRQSIVAAADDDDVVAHRRKS